MKETIYNGDICANHCGGGSHAVCGISHNIDTASKTDSIVEIRPIAGDVDGATLDPVATRLSTSSADGDKDKVGVRLVLQGGHYNGRKQKALVEVLCDDKLDGTEGEWKSDELGIPPPPSAKTAEDGKDKDDVPHQLKKDGAALIWDSYGPSEEDPKNMDVLKLTWKTKHACEKRNEGGSGGGDKGGSGGSGDGDKDKDKGGQDESKHWGFFTWMIILWVPLSPGLPYFSGSAKSFANFFFSSSPQRIPRRRSIPHLWLLAQLQPVRRAGLGPPPARRHDPRRSLSYAGLDPQGGADLAGWWEQRRVQRCVRKNLLLFIFLKRG